MIGASGCVNQEVAEVTDVTEVTEEESEEIDTSNWLTYRNEEYGFEMRYPGNENWKFYDFFDPSYGLNFNLSSNLSGAEYKKYGRHALYISLFEGNPNEIKPEPYETVLNKRQSTFKGRNSVEFIILSGDRKRKTTFVELSDNIFLSISCSPKPEEDNINIYDRILKKTINSIKLNIDQKVINNLEESQKIEIDTSNWLTYRNEKYGFKIKYPEGWFAIEEDDEFTKENFLDFTNYKGSTEEYYAEAEKNPNLEKRRNFFIMIFPQNNTRVMESFDRVKAQYQRLGNEKIVYEKGDKNITLYVVTQRGEEPDETWDWILPSAKAFLEDKDYNFMFYFSTGYPLELKLEILKRALESFELIGVSN